MKTVRRRQSYPVEQEDGSTYYVTVMVQVIYPTAAARQPIHDLIEQLAAEATEQLWDQKVDEQ
jgi:hypothetical protein